MSFIEVSPEELYGTSAKYKSIADSISAMFTNVRNSIDSITSKDCWEGQDAQAYKNEFEGIKNKILGHIDELRQLGPAIQNSATDYKTAESENKVSAERLGSDYRG